MRKSVALLRGFAADQRGAEVTVGLDFFAAPVAIEGDGRVERLVVERTTLDASGGASGTGEHYAIPCGMIITCIGYRSPPIPGVAYDERLGRFANTDGCIAAAAGGEGGLYCVGWARRGPTGTIGTKRPDGYGVADLIAADPPAGAANRAGGTGLDALLADRAIVPVRFRDWQRIEAAVIARARQGAPREKSLDVAEMVAASGRIPG